MNDFLASSKPIEYMQLAASLTALLTGLVALVYALMNRKGITQVQVSVDGKWSAAMDQMAAQEAKIVALQSKLDSVQSASDMAKGKLEGHAEEKAKPS